MLRVNKVVIMVENILLNKWFFTFIVGWVVFLFLVDWKTLSVNMWGGFLCSALELWQDSAAYNVGAYFIQETGITIFNVSAFFTFGIAASMGILYLQYIPKNPILQIIHSLVFAIGFMIFEQIVQSAEMLTTPHWNLAASFFNNTIIFGSLLWFNQFIKHRTDNSR